MKVVGLGIERAKPYLEGFVSIPNDDLVRRSQAAIMGHCVESIPARPLPTLTRDMDPTAAPLGAFEPGLAVCSAPQRDRGPQMYAGSAAVIKPATPYFRAWAAIRRPRTFLEEIWF